MDKLKSDFGRIFPDGVQWFGYVIILSGVLIMLANFRTTGVLLGLTVAFLGGYLSFAREGVELDPASQQYRVYRNYFLNFPKKWQSMEDLPDIAVLQRNFVQKGFSRGQVELSRDFKFYDVTLLSKTHRTKISIRRHSDYELCVSDAKEIAMQMNKRYCRYAPVISAKTRARRR